MSVKKAASNGTVTYFIYDGSNVIMELNSSGNVIARYTYGIDGLISERRGATSYYVACDCQGSVWNLVTLDTNETISASYTYTAFGVTTTVGTDTTGNPFKYVGAAGYYSDSEGGLMLLGARYYNSGVGRFLTLDPIKDGWNWYGYANDNPVGSVDPSGLGACEDACQQGRNMCEAIVRIAVALGLVVCLAVCVGFFGWACVAACAVAATIATFLGLGICAAKYTSCIQGCKPPPPPPCPVITV